MTMRQFDKTLRATLPSADQGAPGAKRRRARHQALAGVSIAALILATPAHLAAQGMTREDLTRLGRLKEVAWQEYARLERASDALNMLVLHEPLLRLSGSEPYGYPWLPVIKYALDQGGDLGSYVSQPSGFKPRGYRPGVKYLFCVGDDQIDPELGLPYAGAKVSILSVLDAPHALISHEEIFRHVRANYVNEIAPGKTMVYVDMVDLTYVPHTVEANIDAIGLRNLMQPLPECFDEFRFDVTRARVGVLHEVSAGGFRDLQFRKRAIELPPEMCPPPEYPDAIVPTEIGTPLSQIRRYFAYELFDRNGDKRDSAGDLISTVVGQVNGSETEYVKGCRVPKEYYSIFQERCTWTVAGIANPSKRMWGKVRVREIPPARGYYLDGEDIETMPISSPDTWEPISTQFCDDASAIPTPPAFTTSRVDTVDEEVLACRDVYGGTYPESRFIRRRERYTTTIDYTTIFKPPNAQQVIVHFGDWWTVDDDCYRVEVHHVSETRHDGMNNCITQVRTNTVVSHVYVAKNNGGYINYGNWVTTANTCHENERDDRWGYDIDGDGRADTTNYKDAKEALQNSGDKPRRVDNCDQSCQSADREDLNQKVREDHRDNNSDDNNDNKGGCFLTTAIVALRGEADDGPTLTLLRQFRDTYMAADPAMAAEIAEYYEIAPQIVATIPADHRDWDWIGAQIDRAVAMINLGDLPAAHELYRNMVLRLEQRWLEGRGQL